jgi:hypothetical protein
MLHFKDRNRNFSHSFATHLSIDEFKEYRASIFASPELNFIRVWKNCYGHLDIYTYV